MCRTVAAWEFKCKKCGEVHYVPYELFDDKTEKSISVTCINDETYRGVYVKNEFHFVIGDHQKISSNAVKVFKP